MVHPSLEGILFTPICPHSLSFRPLVFPDHVQLRVQVPESVRTNELLCSFDGSHHIALMPGDALVVQLCKYPVCFRLFRACSTCWSPETAIDLPSSFFAVAKKTVLLSVALRTVPLSLLRRVDLLIPLNRIIGSMTVAGNGAGANGV